jgi:hypothetical protein
MKREENESRVGLRSDTPCPTFASRLRDRGEGRKGVREGGRNEVREEKREGGREGEI